MRGSVRLVKLYGCRFTIEENFRDTKSIRFGMGFAGDRIKDPARRNRLLKGAPTATLLTLLGIAGESLGGIGCLRPAHPRSARAVSSRRAGTLPKDSKHAIRTPRSLRQRRRRAGLTAARLSAGRRLDMRGWLSPSQFYRQVIFPGVPEQIPVQAGPATAHPHDRMKSPQELSE